MGAWIETSSYARKYALNGVAPHVGAWIETMSVSVSYILQLVAPHVGAWIETLVSLDALLHSLSHPMWVRGLKQSNRHYIPMNF